MMTRTSLIALALVAALGGCAVKLNGKTYGAGSEASGGGPAAASSGAASGGRSYEGPAHLGQSNNAPLYGPAPSHCLAPATAVGQPPYPQSPVDPWIGVVDGKPAITGGRIRPRPEAECSALHDHCLRECAWFPVRHASKLAREPATTVPAIRVTGEGDMFNAADGGILGSSYPTYYRTVPATRRMLTAGAIIVVVDYPYWAPTGEALEGGVLWKMGVLDRVDWEAGKLYLAGETGPFWLSAARVAVLSYQAGGTVEIIGGRSRDELAVKPDEVMLRHPRSH